MSAVRVIALDPQTYTASPLHQWERDWPESNCYVDVWVELLHALGLEVRAVLPFALATDFEDDQWMFFKPPLADLEALYGIRVEELTLWRSLVQHCVDQVGAGKLLTVEVDAFYLPDTRATDYRTHHTKTSIAVNEIDPDARRLSYFHNRGYHSLSGDDFDGLFRLGIDAQDHLPPYCEIVKLDALKRVDEGQLRDQAFDLVRHHLRRRPLRNPFERFQSRIDDHIAWVMERDLDAYHAYVFASVRQCGAAFEFAESMAEWLAEPGDDDWLQIARSLGAISRTSKTLVLKLARVVNAGRMRDLSSHFDDMSRAWDTAYALLDEKVGQGGG